MPKYKSLRVSPVFSKSITVHLYEFLFMSDIRLNLSPHMLRGTDSHLCTSWYSLCGSSWVFSILFVIVLNIFSHWFLQRYSFSHVMHFQAITMSECFPTHFESIWLHSCGQCHGHSYLIQQYPFLCLLWF